MLQYFSKTFDPKMSSANCKCSVKLDQLDFKIKDQTETLQNKQINK